MLHHRGTAAAQFFFAPKNQPILQIERVTGVFGLQGFGPQSDKNVSRETFL
jgi:hypothetical protein